jgi:hypothetical protein
MEIVTCTEQSQVTAAEASAASGAGDTPTTMTAKALPIPAILLKKMFASHCIPPERRTRSISIMSFFKNSSTRKKLVRELHP